MTSVTSERRPAVWVEVLENDLPNDDGVPDHAPDNGEPVDNHDFLTGTNDQGQLYSEDWAFTCHDWDTANWMFSLTETGCAPGASLVEMGPPDPEVPTVGSGGGYGGIYCLALTP